jgi:hypothetical protein
MRMHAERVNTPVRLVVQESASEAPAAEWSSLSANPYESREWFLFNEAYFADTGFRYFCAYQDGRLEAILPVYDRHSPSMATRGTR